MIFTPQTQQAQEDHSSKSQPQKIILASRYLLTPMYLGLIVYMMVYNIAFFGALYESCGRFFGHWGDFAEMTEILKLAAIDGIDMVMIANLIVMITVGSHSIFINEIDNKKIDSDHLPRFIRGITSGILKVKMGSSLVGVSGVHLLTSFVNVDKVGWEQLMKQLVIHLSFILAAYVFAIIEVKIHPPHEDEVKSH